jgi:hypothetical protein
MEYQGQYLSNDEENEIIYKNNKILDDAASLDKGYNKIYKDIIRQDGRKKRTKIDIYTSGCIGSNIRDAEKGHYYSHTVGSYNEELYFKVVMANGICNSRNGSSTLFYTSPQNYMSHQFCEVDQEVITNWEKKRNLRLNILNSKSSSKSSVIVN